MAIARAMVLTLCSLVSCEGEPMLFGEREFLAESLEGRELIPGLDIQLQFGGEQMSAYAGCNSLSGDYHLSEGKLVTPGLGTTELGCSSSLDTDPGQEEWFIGFLESSPSYALDEPRLVLSDDKVTLVLLDREIAAPDRPLRGTTWEARGFVRDGLVFAPAMAGGTIVFDESGAMSIVTPCATGSASYEADDATVKVVGTMLPSPMCPDEEFATTVDATMREVLNDGSLTYGIRDAMMTLMRDEVGLVLYAD